jgi:hypothetical protein
MTPESSRRQLSPIWYLNTELDNIFLRQNQRIETSAEVYLICNTH